MVYKIGLFGTHGTGKTTLVHSISGQLQEQNLSVRAITEIAKLAKERGVQIDKATTLEAQAWILYRQCAAELEGEFYDYDVTACDRTVFDNYCYLKRTVGDCPLYLKMILNHAELHPYTRLYYAPIIEKINPKGRDSDPLFQKDIENLISSFFEEHKIEYIRLPKENRQGWVELIVNQTLKDLE
ncbi:MAG: AAA family ATPase [Candidatus Woesearchaeota archaeon]